MFTKSFSWGNMESEIRARGMAGRYIVCEDGLTRMIW